jgi:hypothetical protein
VTQPSDVGNPKAEGPKADPLRRRDTRREEVRRPRAKISPEPLGRDWEIKIRITITIKNGMAKAAKASTSPFATKERFPYGSTFRRVVS